MDVPEKLLALAAASSWDGGDEVVRAARSILAEMAPYDAGEIAVGASLGFDRWTLTEDDQPLAGEDLLLHVSRSAAALRFDDLHEARAFPRTRERMAQRGFRSLLAVPFGSAGGVEGVVILARMQGWGFVGARLNGLQSVVTMIGLALERAVALTALRRRSAALEERLRQVESDLAGARRAQVVPEGVHAPAKVDSD